jgi:hypothetical protein
VVWTVSDWHLGAVRFAPCLFTLNQSQRTATFGYEVAYVCAAESNETAPHFSKPFSGVISHEPHKYGNAFYHSATG